MTRCEGAAAHWLRAGDLAVAISIETGAVTGMRHGEWSLLDRTELGRSFRLLVPLPDRRSNYVEGWQQDDPTSSITDDGRTVICSWDGVVDDHGNRHPINVQTRITAHEDRIVFAVALNNKSDHVIENVYFPELGDIQPPPSGHLDYFAYSYATGRRSSIWPNFKSDAHRWTTLGIGYWSHSHPFSLGGSIPTVPWILLEDGAMGVYVGVDEPSVELVTWLAELTPGYGDSLDAETPSGARASETAAHTVAVRFAAVHVPYIGPGEHRALTPIAMAAYKGDWHAGVDRYKQRRAAWGLDTALAPSWASEPHSWLQLCLKTGEGQRRRVSFAQLPEIAAECAKHGVAAIQLSGWQEGGMDQSYPSCDPDQELGGSEALRTAIARCQQLGVKIVLFTEFIKADRSTEWFHRVLANEAVKDPYGDYYMHPGYRFDTITQLLDINTKRLVPMCFLSERYLQICQEEFAKIVLLNADGILHDQAWSHVPALVCFDGSHNHRRAAPVSANDREIVTRFRKECGVGDNFLFACEAPYDWQLDAYQLGYHRSEHPNHSPVSRYLRPDAILMTAVTGFDDRNMINQCLLYRYVISYEPFNFQGRLSDALNTVAYGARMDQLRTELREWVWDATFIDTVGVDVRRSDGSRHHPYSAFRHRDGQIAVVVSNFSGQQTDKLSVIVDGQPTPLRYRLVDDPRWRRVDSNLAIPPRSAAVLIPITASVALAD